jgi:predicted esterase
MASQERSVFYETENTYSTLNELTDDTEYVWLACHGLGHLGRFFIRHFKALDARKHFVVAPQAPSKFYQSDDFKYIGASWLTRENTKVETKNIMRYFDAIAEQEGLLNGKKLVVFGFSQGVSVSIRWLASRKISCVHLIVNAGKIPEEQQPENFKDGQPKKVTLVYGKQDEYLTEERIVAEREKAKVLFPDAVFKEVAHDGKHEVYLGVSNI